jgi:hypothetical protein
MSLVGKSRNNFQGALVWISTEGYQRQQTCGRGFCRFSANASDINEFYCSS